MFLRGYLQNLWKIVFQKINPVFSFVVQKRRERINERLRILQNLVPNGTKVKTHADDIYGSLHATVLYKKIVNKDSKHIQFLKYVTG